MSVYTFIVLLRRAVRRSQPATLVRIDVFSPDDKKAVIMEFGK